MSSKHKCKICKRKCTLFTEWTCKCSPNEYFCGDHRLPFDHSCNIDYVSIQKRKFMQENPIIERAKIQKI
jgi:hypothetical protein